MRWQKALLVVPVGLVALAFGGGGCDSNVPDHPTYYENVAPIIQGNCIDCHTKGGIGPFALTTYEEVKPQAKAIVAATKAGTMPPYHVNARGSCNKFKDARVLSDDELEMLSKWADTGAPEGDATNAPPPPPASATLGKIDRTLDPTVDYEPNTSVDDDYRCFIVDTGVVIDSFLTGYEVHPGTPSEVHHVVLYSIDKDAELQAAQALDAQDAAPGYTCFGGAMTGGGRTLAVWAPGTGATMYPKDTGIRMMAGQKAIMQVHYNRPTVGDRTTIDLTIEDKVPLEAVITGAYDLDLNLQPNQANAIESNTIPLPATAVPYRVWGVYPHMHKLGKTMRVDLFDGIEDRCVVDVPDYNFSWQQFYFYDNPIVVAPTATGALSITCTYDTRGTQSEVHFGEGTGDEMCIAGLYVTL